MIGPRSLCAGLVATIAVGIALAPATRAQDLGGGAGVSGEVPSLLELSLSGGGGTGVVAAQVTASIPRTQLLAAATGLPPGGSLRVGISAQLPRALRPSTTLLLTQSRHAVTRSRVLVRTQLEPASARRSAVLTITAAPQTP